MKGSYVFDHGKYDDENSKRVSLSYQNKNLAPERLLLFTFVGPPPNDDYRNYTADAVLRNTVDERRRREYFLGITMWNLPTQLIL